MSKFTTTIKKGKTKTTNFAGGDAYTQTPELELVSILLTSFVENTFYRTSDDTIKRLRELLPKVDPKFAAKAAIFARDKFGMRSVTHVLAGELTSYSAGLDWSKNFYEKVIVRPDDMMEILGYYISNKTDSKRPKFPNSIKKGFAKAFNRFDDYQIAKWRNSNKDVKLIDIVNLCHPVPTEKNQKSLSKLVSGQLKNEKTWESMLSAVGQNASNEEELDKLKADVWKELISTKKIGLFALIRNLRNILNVAPDAVDSVCEMLVNENLIKSSRILPFRFKTAYDEILNLESSSETRKVLVALDTALGISVSNVPKLSGDTLLVLDVSGSMSGRPSDIASLFASILAKSNNCDVMTFANWAKYVSYNPNDSVMTIRDSFKFTGGGTNLTDSFIKANKAYENIVILSDMQSFLGDKSVSRQFDIYKKKFNCNPYVFSFDLAGLGTLQIPQNNIYCLAGFSDKVFDVMNNLKEDPKALINQIESISI